MFDFDRIANLVDEFNEFMRVDVLDFRLPTNASDIDAKTRIEMYEDAMINASNIAIDVEHRLHGFMILKAHLSVEWSTIESGALAKLSYGKYVSDKAKLSPAINDNRDLYQTINHVTATVECGVRAITRLELLQRTASRVIGIGS